MPVIFLAGKVLPMAQKEQEDVLPLTQVREQLHIKQRTLYGWLHEAGIEAIMVDGKNKGITLTQFNQLAFAHGRIPHAAISAADWAALLERIARLEQQVAALTKMKSES